MSAHPNNYIKRLERELREARIEIEACQNMLHDLRSYLLSSKFHLDTTVQVRDVLHRLDYTKYYPE